MTTATRARTVVHQFLRARRAIRYSYGIFPAPLGAAAHDAAGGRSTPTRACRAFAGTRASRAARRLSVEHSRVQYGTAPTSATAYARLSPERLVQMAVERDRN